MRYPILITVLVTFLSHLLTHAAPTFPPIVATLPSTTHLEHISPRSPLPQGQPPPGVLFVGPVEPKLISLTRFTSATTSRGRVFLSPTPLSPLKSYFFIVLSPEIDVSVLRVFTSPSVAWPGKSIMGPTEHVYWHGDGNDLMIKVSVHAEVTVALQVQFRGDGARGEIHMYEEPRNGDDVDAQNGLEWPFGLVGRPTDAATAPEQAEGGDGWAEGGSSGSESAGGGLMSSLWPFATQGGEAGNGEPLLGADGKMKTE